MHPRMRCAADSRLVSRCADSCPLLEALHLSNSDLSPLTASEACQARERMRAYGACLPTTFKIHPACERCVSCLLHSSLALNRLTLHCLTLLVDTLCCSKPRLNPLQPDFPQHRTAFLRAGWVALGSLPVTILFILQQASSMHSVKDVCIMVSSYIYRRKLV